MPEVPEGRSARAAACSCRSRWVRAACAARRAGPPDPRQPAPAAVPLGCMTVLQMVNNGERHILVLRTGFCAHYRGTCLRDCTLRDENWSSTVRYSRERVPYPFLVTCFMPPPGAGKETRTPWARIAAQCRSSPDRTMPAVAPAPLAVLPVAPATGDCAACSAAAPICRGLGTFLQRELTPADEAARAARGSVTVAVGSTYMLRSCSTGRAS